MDEARWLALDDPHAMFEFVLGDRSPADADIDDLEVAYPWCRVSDRKLRLFAVSCCRHVSEYLEDQRASAAVDAAELFADGLMSEPARQAAETAAGEALRRAETRLLITKEVRRRAVKAAASVIWMPAWLAAGSVLYTCAAGITDLVDNLFKPKNLLSLRTLRREKRRIFGWRLHDIVGNPFRPASVHPAWLTSDVVELAKVIYAERAFDRLPILSDALMDAGCDDADILNHCRDNGPHARGCWVVDLLTGRK